MRIELKKGKKTNTIESNWENIKLSLVIFFSDFTVNKTYSRKTKKRRAKRKKYWNYNLRLWFLEENEVTSYQHAHKRNLNQKNINKGTYNDEKRTVSKGYWSM